MAKIHKSIFEWRAIINCQNHPTAKIALFFDSLIKPLILKSETFLKDSQNLIQICENIHFDKKPQIISFDVAALYPNIHILFNIHILNIHFFLQFYFLKF